MNSSVDSLADYGARVQQVVERVYGVPVVAREFTGSIKGDLNGAEIHIDAALNREQRLFLLAHLFGHTVQWNADPAAFEMGRPQQPPVSERRLPGLMEYERQAASYGLSVLHEAGITGIDQWYCDYSACDLAYLMHFYRTGEKQEFRSFWRDNAAMLEPLPVPPFTPRARVFRLDGIVI